MKAKSVAMIMAISVLSALFIGLLVDAVYEAPEYEDFCGGESRIPRPYPVQGRECTFQPLASEQPLVDQCYLEKGQPEFYYDEYGCQQGFKECNYCSRDYQDANELYNKNIFFIITPIAVLLIISGLYWKTEVIGTGFMFSGILLLIYSTMRYFSDMSKVLRVAVIGIELLLVLWISKKKLKK